MYVDAIHVNNKLDIAPMSAIGHSSGIVDLKLQLETLVV